MPEDAQRLVGTEIIEVGSIFHDRMVAQIGKSLSIDSKMRRIPQLDAFHTQQQYGEGSKLSFQLCYEFHIAT